MVFVIILYLTRAFLLTVELVTISSILFSLHTQRRLHVKDQQKCSRKLVL